MSKRFRRWSVMGWVDKKEGSISSLKGLLGQVRGNQGDKRRRWQAAQSCVASAKPLSTPPPQKRPSTSKGTSCLHFTFSLQTRAKKNHPPEPLAGLAKFPAQWISTSALSAPSSHPCPHRTRNKTGESLSLQMSCYTLKVT